MLNKIKKQRGFTFSELMIAMALNGILFVALIAVFVTGLTHYNTVFKTHLLHTQLYAAMNSMVSDVRRAGYWSQASTMIGSNSNINPFQASGTDLSINASNNCILLTYDHTDAGTLPTISSAYDDLRYGYRLSGNAIQSRPWGAVFDCDAASNNWTNITDSNVINVTNLSFSLSSQLLYWNTHTISIRYVTITLSGSLISDSSVSETLTESVRVANDLFA